MAIDLLGPCVEWTRARTHDGYGWTRINGKQAYAHRLAWERAHGPIPTGMCVCHKCDNPPCHNVEHLFLGTRRDNIADCIRKGRRRLSWRFKLDYDTAEAIRARYAAGGDSQRKLASEYGVGQDQISRIVNRKRWDAPR